MNWIYIVLMIAGLWLVISPWILGFSDFNLPRWNSVIFGVLVIILSFWAFLLNKKEN